MRRCHGDGVQRQRPACRCLRVVPLTHERCLAPLGYLTHLPWGQSNGHPALRFESAVHGARRRARRPASRERLHSLCRKHPVLSDKPRREGHGDSQRLGQSASPRAEPP